MSIKRRYHFTDKLLPEIGEANSAANKAFAPAEEYLYKTLELKWNELTSRTKAYVMMYRAKFEELFLRPEPSFGMRITDSIEYDRYRYESWQDRSKLRHKSFLSIQSGYIALIHDAQSTTVRNPNDPDLGVSLNQYVIQYRQEYIFECQLFTERITAFYKEMRKQIDAMLQQEQVIEISFDPKERAEIAIKQGHKDVSDIYFDAFDLFKKLKEKDLKGAPQHIVNFVNEQSQKFDIRFNECCLGMPRLPRNADEATVYKIRNKVMQAIKDFMRKFILEFRRLILDAASILETVSPEQMQSVTDTVVTTDATTTETGSRNQPRFRFKFL